MSLHGTGVRLIVAVHRDSTDELVAGLRDSVVIKQLTVCILHQPTAKSIAISLCYHLCCLRLIIAVSHMPESRSLMGIFAVRNLVFVL